MFTGRKLALTLAFTVLVALAFGVSCDFFQPNTLSSISIQPPSPQIQVGAGNAQTLQAWGTYSDNSRSQITGGVEWTSSDTTVLQIGLTSGVATGVNTGGSATVTASAQGLSATASANVYLGNITGFEVCMGTFGATTTCSNGTTALTWNPNATNTVNQNFVAQGTANGTLLDFTLASNWTIAPTPVAGLITCSNSGASPEVCTVNAGTTASPPTYVITVTYGTSSTATVNVTVTN